MKFLSLSDGALLKIMGREAQLSQNKCVVVNLRTNPYDVYIGRPSTFGNPYPVERHDRKACIELYRTYFNDQVQNDPVFKALVLELVGKRLGCFCSPKACHGDVIAEWVNSHVADRQLGLF